MSAQFTVDTERIPAASGDIARISGEIDGQVSGDDGPAHRRSRAPGRARRPTRFQALVGRVAGHPAQVRASLDSIGGVLAAAGAQYAETEAQTVRLFS